MIFSIVLFKQEAGLEYMSSHKGSYSTEKPLKCDWCDDGFANDSQLNIHKRSHIGENVIFVPSHFFYLSICLSI